MIEVCEDYFYKKKKRKGKSKKIFIAFFLIALIFLYNRYFIAKNVLDICEDYCNSYATSSVNDAILDVTIENFTYSDLVKVEKNQSNDIVLISANWIKVNEISRLIVDKTSNGLNQKIKNGVPIPWLTFSGIGMLSGLGKCVNLKLVTISSINCSFTSDFTACGINQTLHSIYASVFCKINIEYPFSSREIETLTKVLLSEYVIVGKVPEIYLNSGIFSK